MSKTGNLAALPSILSPSDAPTIYYAEDPPYLPRILVFYSPVQAIGSLASTSRIRVTILSAAGFKSYGAFSVAPNSSYYSAVHKLPEDKQRDDVSRGIAFALCRYFSEVPPEVKDAIAEQNLQTGPTMKWGQTHAAQVTCQMNRVTNPEEVIDALRAFSKERPTSPVAAPTKPIASIRKTRPSFLPPEPGSGRTGYGATPSKRITSYGKRTPSATTPAGRKQVPPAIPVQSVDQLESLRFKMCEFVDTESRYISRLQQLIDLVTNQGRTEKSLSSKFSSSRNQKVVNAMIRFPSLLDTMKDLNLAFLDDIEDALHKSDAQAMAFLEQAQRSPDLSQNAKDPMGILTFAKVLLNHFPKFPVPYRDYLDLHAQVSSNLDSFLKEGASSIQQAPSLLMEPAQRISRYGLYIDTMIPHIPATFTIAIRTLEKARKIIAEICEMEPAASTILDSLRIEHESRRRGISPTKILSGLTRSNIGSIREAPALTGSAKERDGPRLFPSLGRSLSRRTKQARPGLQGILSEQDPDHINNARYPPRNDENRPLTSSSALSFGSVSKRPPTSGSTNTSRSGPSPGPNVPVLLPKGSISQSTEPSSEAVQQYKAALMRVEEENYKLLAENAELKRAIRECKCGGAKR